MKKKKKKKKKNPLPSRSLALIKCIVHNSVAYILELWYNHVVMLLHVPPKECQIMLQIFNHNMLQHDGKISGGTASRFCLGTILALSRPSYNSIHESLPCQIEDDQNDDSAQNWSQKKSKKAASSSSFCIKIQVIFGPWRMDCKYKSVQFEQLRKRSKQCQTRFWQRWHPAYTFIWT